MGLLPQTEYELCLIGERATFVTVSSRGYVEKESATFCSMQYSFWHNQCLNFICVGFSISVVPLFRQAAMDLVESTGLPAIDVLAKAIAQISVSTSNSFICFLNSMLVIVVSFKYLQSHHEGPLKVIIAI